MLIFKKQPRPDYLFESQQSTKELYGYLKDKAGQSRNINLYRELALENVSLEMFASYGIWILFMVGGYATSLMFYLFSHRAFQTVISYS